jgi:hypothetical protein
MRHLPAAGDTAILAPDEETCTAEGALARSARPIIELPCYFEPVDSRTTRELLASLRRHLESPAGIVLIGEIDRHTGDHPLLSRIVRTHGVAPGAMSYTVLGAPGRALYLLLLVDVRRASLGFEELRSHQRAVGALTGVPLALVHLHDGGAIVAHPAGTRAAAGCAAALDALLGRPRRAGGDPVPAELADAADVAAHYPLQRETVA